MLVNHIGTEITLWSRYPVISALLLQTEKRIGSLSVGVWQCDQMLK